MRCDEQLDEGDPVIAGWKHFQLGEFDQAVAEFESVCNEASGKSDSLPDATYGLAAVWDLRMPMTEQDKKLAESLYRKVVEKYPDSRVAPWAMLAIARIKHLVPIGQEPDYDEVRKAYRTVWQKYPETQAGQEAFIHLQATYIRTMDDAQIDPAVAALHKFIEDHPDSGLCYAAWSLLAEAYRIQRKPDELLKAQIETLNSHEIDKTNPFIENSWSYWKIATTAEFETGDFDIARKYYQRLIDEYPQDIRCYGSEEALRRMDRTEQKIRAELKAEGRL
jgi:tetratricopeptide (TPR) repeat protein